MGRGAKGCERGSPDGEVIKGLKLFSCGRNGVE